MGFGSDASTNSDTNGSAVLSKIFSSLSQSQSEIHSLARLIEFLAKEPEACPKNLRIHLFFRRFILKVWYDFMIYNHLF
jgi:hypothetical protein